MIFEAISAHLQARVAHDVIAVIDALGAVANHH
jgi:hypothetical protein